MNILDFLRLWPVLNNFYFVIEHSKARREENVFQILYQLGVEFIFLCLSIKTSLAEMLEHFFYILVMFGHAIRVDEYIIQIDYNINIQKVRENVIHELLKGYGSISKTKRYYRLFKWSIAYPKNSLLFITIGDMNQVVSMAKIYL